MVVWWWWGGGGGGIDIIDEYWKSATGYFCSYLNDSSLLAYSTLFIQKKN
jgi:hypothetical protein